MDFKAIEELIDAKKYCDAEQKIESVIKGDNCEKDISIANYLMGHIHTRNNYNKKSIWTAKQSLLKCINSSYPIPDAFCLLADIESDKNIAINHLKVGLKQFDNNSGIYLSLLKFSNKSEQLNLISEIKTKGLTDYALLRKVIEILISYGIWADVDMLSNIAIENNSLSNSIKIYLQLLGAYSKLITNKEQQAIVDALEIFELIAEQDVENSLCYSHYMGVIGCAVILHHNEKVIQYFDKLPENNVIQDLNDGPDCIIDVKFTNIYLTIFSKLSELFSKNKSRKQKNNCLRAFYLYNPYEIYGTVRYTKKHINDLSKYYKDNTDNIIAGCAVFNMQCQFKMYSSSYLTYMDMLNNNLNPNDQNVSFLTAIENCSNEELDRIIEDVCLKMDNHFDMNMSLFVTDVLDSIIEKLWNENENGNFVNIVKITEQLDYSYLQKSDKIFEIAYSYAKCKNPKAINLYELFLKIKPQNASALNNLGVLYNEKSDLLQAKEYFSQAYEFDSTTELYLRNLKNVEALIERHSISFEKVKKEPIWFIGRLEMLYNVADESGKIQCTYKNRPTLLRVRPEKANELVDKMVENNYIEKISDGNYQTPVTYKINPLIKTFLQQKHSKIERNKEYEKISENLNIDELEKIGYTSELITLFNNISEKDFRDILLRDLRECAICLVTEQNKAAIIMCGSIIEALLMNKIIDNGIEKYDIGPLIQKDTKLRKVIDMDINELLFVADKENPIKKEHFHLSQFARSYRNIIHPACEIRKGFKISNDEAKFMWDILLRISSDILS